ncbi:odorant receptor 67c-like [Venturia canescens]|uniref:odorant receptor 67c-like n=1 Tax=Venturia canescens TaxID=32260 RepID=UPI001C9C7A15|nr:odorant receptor 67c-like [Venturia canescens]
MKETRYFCSSNELNAVGNLLSGNIYPLGDGEPKLRFFSILWVIGMWTVKITYFLSCVLGSLYFSSLSTEEVFKQSGALGALCAEVIVSTAYLNSKRTELRKLIDQYNLILIDSDDLRRCIHETLKPYKKCVKSYMCCCFVATSIWSAAPLLQIFNADEFTYTDLTVPGYMPGEPFGKSVLAAGAIFQVFGACSLHFTKISFDLYVIHFIAVLTAQYKFLGEEVSRALRDENGEKDERAVLDALHQCVRHHSVVIQIGRELSKILAFYIGATYLSCILKFCFLAFGVFTFESASIEKMTHVMGSVAIIVQVFLLCAVSEDLLTESTSVTESAFHENWYARSPAVKRVFCMMEMSNRIECRLSAYRVIDLAVPTLALILSKSYSACLLLLEVN